MKKYIFILLYLFIFLAPLSAHELQPQLRIYKTPEALGEVLAKEIVDTIRANQQIGKPTVLGLATGSTPLPAYKALKRILLEEKLDLTHLITFNLDEYVDLPSDHPQSYHHFMYENLFSDLLQSDNNPLGIRPENIHIPNAYAKKNKDLSREELQALNHAFPSKKNRKVLNKEEKEWILQARAEEYEKLLSEYDSIDLQILGIGTNGHIAFLEPGSSFTGKTSLVQLTENTRKDNARFFEGNDKETVPEYALSMGIHTILQAKKIVLLATGEYKAEIVKSVLESSVTPEIPATALRLHPHVVFYLDQTSAAHIKQHRKIVRYHNGRILRNHKIEEGNLWELEGKIIAPQSKADVEIDVGGLIIAPGYIDLQMCGGFGFDFTNEPDKVEEVAKQLPQFGVTAFLPNILSSSKESYPKILSQLRPKILQQHEGATILGIHLEGPFLNPEFHRSHDRALFLSCNEIKSPEDIYGDLEGVSIVTLAPEIEGALEMIKYFREKGIVVAAGHSAASYEELENAREVGLNFVTHLFNGMPSFHHRDPGIVGAVLTDKKLAYSWLADKNHFHPKAVEFMWNAHPEGCVIITDAASAFRRPPGTYTFGPQEIEVQDGKSTIKGTDTLAGSTISMDSAVRYLQECTGCLSSQAIEAASYKPAQILGIENKKGTLDVGADADFIFLDDQLFVKACYIAGELAWH